ncbi:MAG: hypothetical protein Q8R55_03270 [Candidatus Taylorbacteria bacterium]|nr:hypothetical protein [Candidatus Taylorbacteria bacterium]
MEKFNIFKSKKREEPPQPKVEPEKKIKVIRLEDGSINVERPEFLNKFSPEIRELFGQMSWLDADQALKYLAEDRLQKGDFETAEEIVSQIKSSVGIKPIEGPYWGQVDGLVSIAVAEYDQGQQDKAMERISGILNQINESPEYNKGGNLALISKFFIETDQIEKVRELISQIGVERDPNTIWRVVEDLAKHELDKGNYESALSLEDLLKYDTYKIELRVMVARNIGHQAPEKAAEILNGAEEAAVRDKRSPDARVNEAWAFIGRPKTDDPISSIELAKHFFVVGNSEKAQDLLGKAASEPLKPTFDFNQLGSAEIKLEIGKAYLFSNDPGHDKTKEHIYSALQSLARVKYSGQYSEEMAYAKSDVYKKAEEVLVEIGDLEGLRRLLDDEFINNTASSHRIRMDILTVLLNRKQAD